MSGDMIEPSHTLDDSQTELPALGSKAAPGAPGTSSADELVLALGQISPDPYLEEFQPAPDAGIPTAGPEPVVAPTGPWSRDDVDLDVPPSAEITAVEESPFGVAAVAAAKDLDPTGRPATPEDGPRPGAPTAVSPPSTPSTSERFAALDLSAPPSKLAAESARKNPADDDEEYAYLADDDEEDPHPTHHHSNWLMALLASYASAVTLGLIWVLWGHRVARESATVEPDPFPAVEVKADPGHRAGQSRRYVAPDPLPAERIVGLGQTIVMDSLEVTPLAVLAAPVILRRELNEFEVRRGGNDALKLTLRLKNRSSDSILVPLDEAFIRERGRGIRDSFIEAGPSQQINMYPLAIVSEWSIAGQEFRELKPGESYETAVVSAPDAFGQVAPEMTWRLRLRTDVNQTATLGIRFQKEDIRRMLPRETPDPSEQPEPGDTQRHARGTP